MQDVSDNPLGLDGFEFVELTSPEPARMIDLLERLGFTAWATHPTRDVVRYKQGRINLLVNRDPAGQGADFRAAHGPSANGMAFRVADAPRAFAMAVERGARPADASRGALGPDSHV
ncbi:MAG: 4-hydroxyphenylpyruvate dioxygenase, partial [Labilithrix sp.]|nr:4-hydroxyphenylpyruvate dioxygenase [Labilithrix sp.]